MHVKMFQDLCSISVKFHFESIKSIDENGGAVLPMNTRVLECAYEHVYIYKQFDELGVNLTTKKILQYVVHCSKQVFDAKSGT